MKMIYQLFLQIFTKPHRSEQTVSKEKSFFDYSSGEKIKIMRAAGIQAQREQQQLLKAYDARFGSSI